MRARVKAMIEANRAKPKKRGRPPKRVGYRRPRQSPEGREAQDRLNFERFQHIAVFQALDLAVTAKCYFCQALMLSEPFLKVRDRGSMSLEYFAIRAAEVAREQMRKEGWAVTLGADGEMLACPECVEIPRARCANPTQDTSSRSVEEFQT